MNIQYKSIIKVVFLILIIIITVSWVFQSKKKITIFIVGDSTVKCGQDKGDDGHWGWGNPIKYHFDTSYVKVENYALGGTSSRTFQTRGLWQQVVDKIQPGDYVLIQFGHNDGGPYNTGRARASIKGTGEDTLFVIMEATGKRKLFILMAGI
jgi:lysophospholipase L1-like esterase